MLEKLTPRVSGLLGAPMPETVVSWPDPARLIKSGARVLEILEWFSDVRRSAFAQEIAEALDLPVSSTNDLLKSLVESGHLLFNKEDKSYFPSPRVLRLSESVTTPGFEAVGLYGMTRALQERTRECVAVSAQNGHRMQFISVLPTPGVVLDEVHAGLKFPMVGSASGTALLAKKPDADVIAIVRKVTVGYSHRAREEAIQLTLQHVRAARINGFGVSFLDVMPYAMSIAVAFRAPVCRTPLALCVGGSRSSLEGREPEMAAVLREVISECLHDVAVRPESGG